VCGVLSAIHQGTHTHTHTHGRTHTGAHTRARLSGIFWAPRATPRSRKRPSSERATLSKKGRKEEREGRVFICEQRPIDSLRSPYLFIVTGKLFIGLQFRIAGTFLPRYCVVFGQNSHHSYIAYDNCIIVTSWLLSSQ